VPGNIVKKLEVCLQLWNISSGNLAGTPQQNHLQITDTCSLRTTQPQF